MKVKEYIKNISEFDNISKSMLNHFHNVAHLASEEMRVKAVKAFEKYMYNNQSPVVESDIRDFEDYLNN